MLSWLVILLSIVFAVGGLRSSSISKNDELQTTAGSGPARSGIYRYVRHPVYASLMFFGLGTFLKVPSLFGGMVLFGAVFSLNAAARAKESVNIERFGDIYRDYMDNTKMFIPYLF